MIRFQLNSFELMTDYTSFMFLKFTLIEKSDLQLLAYRSLDLSHYLEPETLDVEKRDKLPFVEFIELLFLFDKHGSIPEDIESTVLWDTILGELY